MGGTIVGRSENVVWGRGEVALKVVKGQEQWDVRWGRCLLSRVGWAGGDKPGGWEEPDY